jgi:predicted dehydrogenase
MTNNNGKVRVAIIGCGNMAGAHARRFRENPDVEIVALCDVENSIVEKFIERHLPDYMPPPKMFDNVDDLYKGVELDAVAIVTPHTIHFEQGMQALEAGCDVLMEKPMVTDSGQAHALAAKAAETGKLLVIGYNTPCTPEFKYLRELVRSNELGTLETVSCWLAQNWKTGTANSWRQRPELSGGGQMYDSGAHLFNSLVWTIEQPIAEVQAFVDNSGTLVDINGSVNVRFANGILATVVVNGNSKSDGCGMTLNFTNGRVDIDGWNASYIRIYKGKELVKYPPITGNASSPNDNFIDAILGRDEPRTTPLNGVLHSELMDAIYESARTGAIARPKART